MRFKSLPILINVPKKRVGTNILRIVCSVLIIAVFVFLAYVGDYYRASNHALYIASHDTEKYKVKEIDDGLAFIPESADAGLIFYPGGKVEYTAYAPLMAKFAECGILCVLIEMPFNLAVFNVNAADGVRAAYCDIERWYIGGHSLGGAMAASYVSGHAHEFEGLILLGAYSANDLRGTGLNVISVYGSNDRVLNREKYNSNLGNLPDDFGELVIDGGCHSYFGDYGKQSGDGTPTITREEQQSATVAFVKRRMESQKIASDGFVFVV